MFSLHYVSDFPAIFRFSVQGGNEGHRSEKDDPGEEVSVVWLRTEEERRPRDEKSFKDGVWGEEGEEDQEEMDGLCEW